MTEGRDRVGGNITTVANKEDGLLWEEGPNSFQPNDSILQAAVRGKLGLWRSAAVLLVCCLAMPRWQPACRCSPGTIAVQHHTDSSCHIPRVLLMPAICDAPFSSMPIPHTLPWDLLFAL